MKNSANGSRNSERQAFCREWCSISAASASSSRQTGLSWAAPRISQSVPQRSVCSGCARSPRLNASAEDEQRHLALLREDAAVAAVVVHAVVGGDHHLVAGGQPLVQVFRQDSRRRGVPRCGTAAKTRPCLCPASSMFIGWTSRKFGACRRRRLSASANRCESG